MFKSSTILTSQIFVQVTDQRNYYEQRGLLVRIDRRQLVIRRGMTMDGDIGSTFSFGLRVSSRLPREPGRCNTR